MMSKLLGVFAFKSRQSAPSVDACLAKLNQHFPPDAPLTRKDLPSIGHRQEVFCYEEGRQMRHYLIIKNREILIGQTPDDITLGMLKQAAHAEGISLLNLEPSSKRRKDLSGFLA